MAVATNGSGRPPIPPVQKIEVVKPDYVVAHLKGETADALKDLIKEYEFAVGNYGHFNSAHEGWAIILEEVDELWKQVCKKRKDRDVKNMREEALQIAAAALRFALDCPKFTNEPIEVRTGIDAVLRQSWE